MHKIFFLAVILVPCFGNSQIENKTTYLRFTIEDDYFKPLFRNNGSIDRYYTTGLKLEYYNLSQKRNLVDKIMPFSKKSTFKSTSYSIGGNIYTPADLNNHNVDSSDRPYAGWLYFSIRGIYNRTDKHIRRITVDYSLGVLGPPSLQGQLQTGVHKILNEVKFGSNTPEGWSNQINTALALNGNLRYEPSWLHSKNLDSLVANQKGFVEFFPSMEVNLGSVMDYLKLGAMLSIETGGGKSFFHSENTALTIFPNLATNFSAADTPYRGKKISFNFFFKPSVTLLAYNSMLSGGLLAFSPSKYVLTSSQVKHVYCQGDLGLAVKFKKFGFLYTCSYRTPEFKNALQSFWAGFSFLFLFNNH